MKTNSGLTDREITAGVDGDPAKRGIIKTMKTYSAGMIGAAALAGLLASGQDVQAGSGKKVIRSPTAQSQQVQPGNQSAVGVPGANVKKLGGFGGGVDDVKKPGRSGIHDTVE